MGWAAIRHYANQPNFTSTYLGVFSLIVKTDCETDGSSAALDMRHNQQQCRGSLALFRN